jgi:acylphosphatase
MLFTGHVQGVGFRYTTDRIAHGCRVTGYVRNLRDGRVEVVAEGEPGELDRFVAAIEQAMAGYIRDWQRCDEPATGEFSSFSVRF